VKNNRLMITTGSLQAIHILAKAFTDPGDPVLVGSTQLYRALLGLPRLPGGTGLGAPKGRWHGRG